MRNERVIIHPNFDAAANRATRVLIDYHVHSAPIDPIPLLKRMKCCKVFTFAEMSRHIGIGREELINTFDASDHDAITSVFTKDGVPHYIVAYNMRLPQYIIQRALARELGHIVLHHDGSKPEQIRNIEAQCFAYHLLCPRALIHSIQEAGVQITTEILGNITGCYERCLVGMRKTPATSVRPHYNRMLKEQFSNYVSEFLDFQQYLTVEDDSMIANFGTFMDGYEE